MQSRRTRLAKEATPGLESKPQDTGKASFQITKFHRADQRSEVSAERTQNSAILGARIELRDQKDRGAGKRCGYCLRESRRLFCVCECAHRLGKGIDLHRVSS